MVSIESHTPYSDAELIVENSKLDAERRKLSRRVTIAVGMMLVFLFVAGSPLADVLGRLILAWQPSLTSNATAVVLVQAVLGLVIVAGAYTLLFAYVNGLDLDDRSYELEVLNTRQTERLSVLLDDYPAGKIAVARWLDMGLTIRVRDLDLIKWAAAEAKEKRRQVNADNRLREVAGAWSSPIFGVQTHRGECA